jgi:hypothetical protein
MMEISYVTSVTVIAPLVTPPVIAAAIPAANAIVLLVHMLSAFPGRALGAPGKSHQRDRLVTPHRLGQRLHCTARCRQLRRFERFRATNTLILLLQRRGSHSVRTSDLRMSHTRNAAGTHPCERDANK